MVEVLWVDVAERLDAVGFVLDDQQEDCPVRYAAEVRQKEAEQEVVFEADAFGLVGHPEQSLLETGLESRARTQSLTKMFVNLARAGSRIIL